MIRAIVRNAPMLLLHGLGSTGKTLRPVCDALVARGYHVCAPTLAEADRKRAMSGASLSHVGLHQLLSEASAHADRLRQLASGVRPVICGHSNGSLLALALAEAGQASRIILLCPVAPPSIGFGVPGWVQRAFFRLSFGRGWRSAAISVGTRCILDPDPPPLSVAKTLLPDSGRILADVLALPPNSRFTPQPPLECGCTVIAGQADRIVSANVSRKIAERFGAEFHVIAKAGHWLPTELQYAEQIAALIAGPARPSSLTKDIMGGTT
ncbi:MAG: alpha/beta hydrolase [Pseudomonadota bacterium]